MFEGVLNTQEGSGRTIRKGLLASLGVHGAVLSVALLLPGHPAQKTEWNKRLVYFGIPHAPAAAPIAAPPHPGHAAHHPHGPVLGHRVTAAHPEPIVDVDTPDAVDVDAPDTTAIGTSAVGSSGPIGATANLGVAGPNETIDFDQGAGMTPPRRIGGVEPTYTLQAEEAHVSGVVSARCEITPQGTLEGCRVLKGLPFMNEAVLSALATQRFTPVLFHGQPVRVAYVFQFRFELPR